jgi:hypothetical protein
MAKKSEQKPRIVLVVNVHPNETPITKHLAKLLKPALENQGNIVDIVTVPKERNLFEQLANMNLTKITFKQLQRAWHRSLDWLQGEKSKNKDAVFIELHSTLDEKMFNYAKQSDRTKNPSKISTWKAKLVPTRTISDDPLSGNVIQAPLTVRKIGKRHFEVEITAKYKESSQNHQKMLAAIDEHLIDQKTGQKMKLPQKVRNYFVRDADLLSSKRANYLHELVIRKIADVVNKSVKMDLGIFRTPATWAHVDRKRKKVTTDFFGIKRARTDRPKKSV